MKSQLVIIFSIFYGPFIPPGYEIFISRAESNHITETVAFQNSQIKILDENSQNLLDQNPPTALKQGKFYNLQMDLGEDLASNCKEKNSKT